MAQRVLILWACGVFDVLLLSWSVHIILAHLDIVHLCHNRAYYFRAHIYMYFEASVYRWSRSLVPPFTVAQIRPRSAIQLAGALRQNMSLTELDLRENSLGPTGMKAIADALAANDTMRTLHLQV